MQYAYGICIIGLGGMDAPVGLHRNIKLERRITKWFNNMGVRDHNCSHKPSVAPIRISSCEAFAKLLEQWRIQVI